MIRRIYFTLLVIALLSISSSVWGDAVTTLLEEGIYAEETKGDLDEAISIYQKIIDGNEGNPANIAKAYYRLGTCYLKTGDGAKAEEIFKEILARFSKQEEIISAVKAQMSRLDILQLEPEPWSDDETCCYSVKSMAGMEIGKNIWTIINAVIDGNDIWRIENYLTLPADGIQRFTRVDVNRDNFLPVSGVVKSAKGEKFRGVYEQDHVQLTIDSAILKSGKTIPVSGIVYDHEEIAHLLRRLPVKDGYSTSLSVFSLQSGNTEKFKVRIKGMETITVPAGTFDCYYIELEDSSGEKRKVWFSADDKKYLVKVENPVILELERIAQVSREEREVFNDDEFKLSMSAPRGWYFVKSAISTPYKMILQIITPEINSSVMFIINAHGGIIKKESFRSLVEQEVNSLNGFFRNYTVRPSSRISGEIEGLPTISSIADYDDNDKKMVEYRTYILGDSNIYAYVIRTEDSNFNSSKQEFDSVIQSFYVEEN